MSRWRARPAGGAAGPPHHREGGDGAVRSTTTNHHTREASRANDHHRATTTPTATEALRRAALAGAIDPDHAVTVSGAELERLLSGGRVVGRARVVHTVPGADLLAAVLAGLRRL